jgi:hypothetical protein
MKRLLSILFLVALAGIVGGSMGYLTRSKDDPGDIGRAADQNQSIDNEEYINTTGLRPIQDVHLAANAASIDFASIPATYRSLKIVASLRTIENATGGALNMQMNADAGNNYDYATANMWHSATLVTTVGRAQTAIVLSGLVALNAPANVFSPFEILIPDYADAGKYKGLIAQALYIDTLALDAGIKNVIQSGQWRSTVAINRLTLTSGGNFLTGSRATLYGIY